MLLVDDAEGAWEVAGAGVSLAAGSPGGVLVGRKKASASALLLRRMEGRYTSSARRLAHPPIHLIPEERTVVLSTVQQVCRRRGWELYAANVPSNHVHAVIRAEPTAERVMNEIKVWATRRVLEAGLRERGVHWVQIPVCSGVFTVPVFHTRRSRHDAVRGTVTDVTRAARRFPGSSQVQRGRAA